MPYKNTIISNSNVPKFQAEKKSQFYVGFSSVNPAGTKLFDLELIKQDILNQFKTKKGERVMNPTFGSVIWDLLMEPLTDRVKQVLEDDINRICNSDPRVTPIRIEIVEFPSGYILELTLLLKGTNQADNMKLTFDQDNGLSVQ